MIHENKENDINTLDYSTLAKENSFRMSCYNLLKSGFSYPTKENCETLKSTPLKNLVNENSLFSFINDIPPLDQLEIIYTTFFDLVYQEKGCYLREGEYLNNKASISRLLLECKGFYKNFGLYIPPNELPDFIGIELEFMYYLTYLLIKEYSAMNNDKKKETSHIEHIKSILSAQHDFLNRHLFSFLHSVKQCIDKYDKLVFYSKLSEFGVNFIASDIDFVNSSLSSLKFFEK